HDPVYCRVGAPCVSYSHRRHAGNIDYPYVPAHALNVGVMKAVLAEGHASFYNYLQAFGLTQPSGIDVAGENFIPPPSVAKMQDSQFATASFGQGIDVTWSRCLQRSTSSPTAASTRRRTSSSGSARSSLRP